MDSSTAAWSRWYCGTSGNKWIQLDLNKTYYVDKWEVDGLGVAGWAASCNLSDYQLQGSTNGSTWTTLDTVSGNTVNSTSRTITPTTVRYVRLYITKGNQSNNYWASVSEFRVYALSPVVTSVAVPSSGTYAAGQTMSFTVNYSAAVTVTGTPKIPITLDSETVYASYVSGSGTQAITFQYTPSAGNYRATGISLGTSITTDSATIADGMGNSADLTLQNTAATTDVLVDARVRYNVSVGTLTGGSITTNVSSAVAGTTVNLTITPNSGMQLKANSLKYNDGSSDYAISGTSFTLPAANVTISAEFESIPATTYTIGVGTLTGGSITADVSSAVAGTTVNLTITPNSGMQLKANSLKYNDGSSDYAISGTSFTLPAANVTISAEFESIPATTYTIGVGTLTGGSITTNVSSAVAGTTVNLTITPNSGMQLKANSLKYNDGSSDYAISGTSFTLPAANVTISAEFESIPAATYIVSFDKNGGTVEATPSTISVATGMQLGTFPTAPTRTGYTFSGWNTAADGGGTVVTTTMIVTGDITVYAKWTPTSSGSGSASGSGGSGGSGSSNTPQTTVTGSKATTTASVSADSNGTAQATITQSQMNNATAKAIAASKEQGSASSVEIQVMAPANTKTLETLIPAAAVTALTEENVESLTIASPVASVTFGASALHTISSAAASDVTIAVASVDKTSLSETVRQLVGDRPVLNLSVTSGDSTISQFGGAVTVAIPYTPQAGEDTSALVIYYINAEGSLETVSNGQYDAAAKAVTFTTSHFSQYAIGYNQVGFADVTESDWYGQCVDFIAARGITNGTDGKYCPSAKLTRGDFLVMLMRAYSIAADEVSTNNFNDAGNTYYTNYLSAAKRLGITNGIGDNLFAPSKTITRQEMFAMLYNCLMAIDALPSSSTESARVSFTDSDQVAAWAEEAVTLFAETGTIHGNNGQVLPTSTATRAELAQLLYNLLAG